MGVNRMESDGTATSLVLSGLGLAMSATLEQLYPGRGQEVMLESLAASVRVLDDRGATEAAVTLREMATVLLHHELFQRLEDQSQAHTFPGHGQPEAC